MCLAPDTPKIQKPAPEPPAPIDTATTLRGPNSATRDSTTIDQKRKGRNALRIVRDPTSANVPSSNSGVNV